ncbi:MAG TPA: type II toxin-antitoxin system ParD family antitoxin [Bryobacteraceae bacterium]|jgi:putative addiction module CopG family antidote
MDVTLSPEFEQLVNEKLRTGEYRSADEVVSTALQLLKERDEDRAVMERVNRGEPLPVDERFYTHLEMLLEEAEDSGPPVEVTEQDWEDIRKEVMERIQAPKQP